MAPEIAGNINTTLHYSGMRFEWEIDNDTVRSKNAEEFLVSPKFTTNFGNGDSQWQMNLHNPTGSMPQYLIFCLTSDSPDSDEFKDEFFSFTIINDKGDDITSYKYVDLGVLLHVVIMGARYIPKDFVENPVNGILRNNILKFAFELKVKMQKIKSNEATDQQVEYDVSSRLEEKYEALLTSGKFSDVSLISEGKTMKVHKCILAQSSPVFAAMFDAEMKEKQDNTVEIPDVKYDVLVEMIRFVYAGKVNNIDAVVGGLAVAADKYALDSLKNMCEKTMMKNMSLDNVIGCLQIADKIRMDNLKKKAIEYIVHNASDVSDRPEFKLLPYDIVCEVFRCLANKT